MRTVVSWLVRFYVFVILSVNFTLCVSYFFFFKQKTAYEMRISDWSSDVCSSDLRPNPGTREKATHDPSRAAACHSHAIAALWSTPATRTRRSDRKSVV